MTDTEATAPVDTSTADLEESARQDLAVRQISAVDAAAEAAMSMPGMAGRDEFYCVPRRAEALTPLGWVPPEKLSVGDQVLAYNPLTHENRWARVTDLHEFEAAQTYRITSRGFRATATAAHRWIVERWTGSGRFIRGIAQTDQLSRPWRRIITAAPGPDDESALTDREAAILGWILTDGHIQWRGNGLAVSIGQAKFVETLRSLLGDDASEHISEKAGTKIIAGRLATIRDQYVFRLRASFARDILTRAGIVTKADAITAVMRLGRSGRRAMFDAMMAANGPASQTAAANEFSTGHLEVMGAFEALAALLGEPTGERRKRGACWLLTVRRSAGVTIDTLSIVEAEIEPVWCPTTDLGTWVCRLDGQVFITGNSMAMQAKLLAMSGAAPKAIRGNPHVALHIVMIGRDLGISPSAAVELIDVIETRQGPRPSLSPQLLNGQIRRLGLGSIVPVIQTDRRCVSVALGPHGQVDARCRSSWPTHVDGCSCMGIIGETEFTWEDAQQAGLAGKHCQPGDHKVGGDGRCPCATGYRNWPKRMCWWRSSGFCADDYFPEAGLGLYTAEELGAVVDADGRAIDAASVELPPGYEDQTPAGARTADTPVADEDAWRLQERVYALPDEAKAAYAERWKNMPALAGFTIRNHPAAKTALAESLLRGVEAQWKARGEFGPEAALESLRTDLAGVVSGLWLVLSPPAARAEEPEPFTSVTPAPSAPPEEPAAVETAETAPKPAEATTDPDPANVEEPADVPRGTKAEAEPDAVDAAIAEVKHMDLGDVKKELVDRTLSARGAEASVRLRLAMRLAEERGAPMQPTLGGADG